MPKLLNRIPGYCHHRATGQAYVWIDGRMVYLGPFGKSASRARYDQIIAEWIAAGRRLPVDPHAITVAEVVAAFRRHAKSPMMLPSRDMSRLIFSTLILLLF